MVLNNDLMRKEDTPEDMVHQADISTNLSEDDLACFCMMGLDRICFGTVLAWNHLDDNSALIPDMDVVSI